MPLWFYTRYEQKFSNLRPLLSINFPNQFRKSKKFGHCSLGSGGKKTIKRSEKIQNTKKIKKKSGSESLNLPKTNFYLCGNFTPLYSKSGQISDHFFQLLFPKDSESLKTLDIGLQKVRAKRRLNGASKVNRNTDRQTHIWTNQLIESIGKRADALKISVC